MSLDKILKLLSIPKIAGIDAEKLTTGDGGVKVSTQKATVFSCLVFLLVPSYAYGNHADEQGKQIIIENLADTAQGIIQQEKRICSRCGRLLSPHQPVCPVCPLNYTSKREARIEKSAHVSPVSFGFKGGLNIAGMFGSEIDYLQEQFAKGPYPKAGINVGGFIAVDFFKSHVWYLQVEGYFSTKGYRADFDKSELEIPSGISNVDFYVRARRNFFEIPLLVKVKPVKQSLIRPFFIAGPALSLIVLSKDEAYLTYKAMGKREKEKVAEIDYFRDTVYVDSLGNQVHYSFDSFYRSYDINLLFGAGVDFRINKNTAIFFEFRYAWGLLNLNNISFEARQEMSAFVTQIDQQSGTAITGMPVLRSSTFMCSIGFEFFF